MAAPRPRRRLSLPLLLLCLGLGYLVYYLVDAELSVPEAGAVPATPEGSAVTLPDEPEFKMPPLESYAETLVRPLFMATRRPPEPLPEVAPEPELEPVKPAPTLVGLDLVGVVTSPAGRLVLIKSRKSRELVRLKEGEDVEGWIVHQILKDRVLLERAGTTEELKLEDKARPSPGAKRKPGEKRAPAPRVRRPPSSAEVEARKRGREIKPESGQ